LTPARLWKELDDETRLSAARSLYAEPNGRREGDAAVAAAIRFRDAAVRKLPVDRRIQYLLRSVVIDEAMASSLLMALHLGDRSDLLGAFLDHLEIPHDGGLIDESYDLEPPDAAHLRGAVEAVESRFPPAHVDVYLLSLLALDEDTWGALRDLLDSRG
jgi:hypothetical protein